MSMRNSKLQVSKYLSSLPSPQKKLAKRLIQIIRTSLPKLKEEFRDGRPHFKIFSIEGYYDKVKLYFHREDRFEYIEFSDSSDIVESELKNWLILKYKE